MRYGYPARFVRALLLVTFLLAAAAVPAQTKPVAVLLYDGRLPEQVALEAAVREAVAPYAEKVELRSMHAGRAETVPFLKLHGFTRADAPLLLLMDGPGEKAGITRKVTLKPQDRTRAVQRVIAVLKLAPPPVKAGSVVAFAADGGAEEQKLLVSAAGTQRVDEGSRRLEPGSVAVYRLPLPEGIQTADLRGELAGNYAVDAGNRPEGPWTPLMDSYRYFGGAEDSVREATRPVADLAPVLEHLGSDLYLRVHPNGRGANAAVLTRLEVTALGPGEKSGQAAWLTEADRIGRERLANLLPKGVQGTPLAGTLSKSTVLTADHSPYVMTGDLLVSIGTTLTVEPGVTVLVTGNSALRVQGELVARGSREKPIVFASASPRQPDDWKGIVFAPIPGRPSGAKSVLEYCRISNAAAVELNRFGGELSHCRFEGGAAGIVLRDGGKGKVHHNRFQGCAVGLVLDAGAGEVIENEWARCTVGLEVRAVQAKLPFRFEKNSVVESRLAAVSYPKGGRPVPPLALGGNFWSGTPAEKLVGPAGSAGEVALAPRLEIAPDGVGAGW